MIRRIVTEYNGTPLEYGIRDDGDLYWFGGIWLGKETDDFIIEHATNLLLEEKCLKRTKLIDKMLN